MHVPRQLVRDFGLRQAINVENPIWKVRIGVRIPHCLWLKLHLMNSTLHQKIYEHIYLDCWSGLVGDVKLSYLYYPLYHSLYIS